MSKQTNFLENTRLNSGKYNQLEYSCPRHTFNDTFPVFWLFVGYSLAKLYLLIFCNEFKLYNFDYTAI